MGQFCSKRRSDDGPSVDPPDVEGGNGDRTFSEEEMEEMKRIVQSVGGMPVVFGDEYGKDREVIFRTLPLGLRYSHKPGTPISKIHQGGQAAQLGVCVGWKVRKICGQALDCKDFYSIGVAVKKLLEEVRLEGTPEEPEEPDEDRPDDLCEL